MYSSKLLTFASDRSLRALIIVRWNNCNILNVYKKKTFIITDSSTQ